jgi:hypothetical protein
MLRDAANFQALSPLSFLGHAASVYPQRLVLINCSLRQAWGTNPCGQYSHGLGLGPARY